MHPTIFDAQRSRERLIEAGLEPTDPAFAEIFETEFGSGEAIEYLTDLARAALEMQCQVDAMKRRADQIKARMDRFTKANERLRAELAEGLITLGRSNLQAPDLQVVVAAGPVSVKVLEPSLLPDDMWRVKREPNLTAIKQVLEREGSLMSGEGKTIACLSNGASVARILTR